MSYLYTLPWVDRDENRPRVPFRYSALGEKMLDKKRCHAQPEKGGMGSSKAIDSCRWTNG